MAEEEVYVNFMYTIDKFISLGFNINDPENFEILYYIVNKWDFTCLCHDDNYDSSVYQEEHFVDIMCANKFIDDYFPIIINKKEIQNNNKTINVINERNRALIDKIRAHEGNINNYTEMTQL
jgi:phosphopantothenoylcysteine synthetase/decarboxylase